VDGLPIGIWALLVGAGLVVFGGLGVIAWAQRSRPEPTGAAASHGDLEDEDVAGLTAHAAAAREAAGRAAAIAGEARARASAAAGARDVAWRAQEVAQRVAETARQAASSGWTERPGSGPVAAEPTVTRAALSAYRRGDLSVEQLRVVWQQAAGWTPELLERERAAQLAAAGERDARRAHDRAALVARQADRAAHVAEVAAIALADEATQAAAEAHEALLAARRPGPWRPRVG